VDLITNVYAGNPAVVERQRMVVGNLLAHGVPAAVAQNASLAQFEQMVMRQAAMLSYNDAWMVILLTFVCVSPAILLLRKPRGGAGAGGDAH
jgi:DHA2 family multidrug resistance protein